MELKQDSIACSHKECKRQMVETEVTTEDSRRGEVVPERPAENQ
jgi:hypothetical protein